MALTRRGCTAPTFLPPIPLHLGTTKKFARCNLCHVGRAVYKRLKVCATIRDGRPAPSATPPETTSVNTKSDVVLAEFGDNTELPDGSQFALASSAIVAALGAAVPLFLGQMNGVAIEEFASHYTMLALLLGFGTIHSGLASLRPLGVEIIGERLYRVLFAGMSLPTAGLTIAFFIAHRYDGVSLWSVQGVPLVHWFVAIVTSLSFLLLYPATFDLAQVAAIKKPRLTIFERGITRITRHPQVWGQVLWCIAHSLWLGSSFAIVASCGLVSHHLFGVWNGDRRLRDQFGDEWLAYAKRTSIVPFGAVVDKRQKLDLREFITPAYAGVALFIWAFYRLHPAMLRFIGELHL